MYTTIEILPVTLLDEQRPLVDRLHRLARSLGLEFGWHYLLDLTWMLSRLGDVRGKTLMDAGAGTGLMQWFLAEQGAHVFSVDRASRAALPLRFRRRFDVSGLRPDDLLSENSLPRRGLKSLLKSARETLRQPPGKAAGRIIIYNQDLVQLQEIPADSLDAVVAVSALEHNSPPNLALVVQELMRLLKPGGALLATLGAARHQDWFHEPSQGWCYSADSLRRIFDLPSGTPDNYAEYDRLFASLEDCAELRDNLAGFYAKSGDNGMPWGRWEPQYQPVGVIKVKE